MSHIITITPNPAVDESTSVAVVSPDKKLRCTEPASHPGGGGVNVARAIRKLGGDAIAIFPAGGAAGDLLETLLEEEGVSRDRIPIAGSTRRNLNVREESTGKDFRFCMPGPILSPREWQLCLDRLRESVRDSSYVVGSGSLPPGAPVDFYARAAAIASGAGAKFVLDTSGEPLRAGLRERPYLVKPSLSEFRELTGTRAETPLEEAGRQLIAEGTCRVLVVSLGAEGAFWMDAKRQERVGSPAVSVASSIGAGDSLVAGIVFALSRGLSISDAVGFGVAAGAAAVLNPGTELCRGEDVERLVPCVDGGIRKEVGVHTLSTLGLPIGTRVAPVGTRCLTVRDRQFAD
jgi:6-phosphofructokinase 2